MKLLSIFIIVTINIGLISPRSSGVEHFLGKEEVVSSSLIVGSTEEETTKVVAL